MAHARRLLLLAAIVALLAGSATGQQFMPFSGGGQDEPDRPTNVYVSTYIDRLMFVDDKNYEFQALVFVYLSWSDPRAKEQEAKNRAKLSAPGTNATCKLQCQLYPQNQPNPVQGCCDDVWLPYVSFPTLKLLSQDRVLRWGVNLDPESDGVGYWTIFLGTFMASFDLRAFPFDTQRLHVQMEVPGWAGGNIVLKPSSAGTRLFNTNPDGDALSGWRVVRVRMANYDLPLCQRYYPSASSPSALDDPSPLVSSMLWSNKSLKAKPASCAAALRLNPSDPSFLVYTRQSLDREDTRNANQPLNVSGVTCTIVIERYYTQWIMTAIMPLIASTWFGFICFLLPRESLEARLGAVLTIFVAQAAIQFVVSQDLPNSSYMTALQMMVAAGYVVLILIGIESVLIWWVTTYHQHHQRYQRHKNARRQFESDLEVQMQVLQAKLAELLARGAASGPSGSKRQLSRSLSALRSPYTAVQGTLKAARSSHSKAHLGSGRSAASASGSEYEQDTRDAHARDARGAAAAAAVAAADAAGAGYGSCFTDSNSGPLPTIRAGGGSDQAHAPSPFSNNGSGSGKDSDAMADAVSRRAARSASDSAKVREAQREAERLQQQIDKLKAHTRAEEEQRRAAAAPRTGGRFAGNAMLFGRIAPRPAKRHVSFNGDDEGSELQGMPLPATAEASGGSDGKAADPDSVSLFMQQLDDSVHGSGNSRSTSSSVCLPWRLCTSFALYLDAVRRDEHLCDQLAYLLNKWIAIIQFCGYNASLIAIFVFNFLAYQKS